MTGKQLTDALVGMGYEIEWGNPDDYDGHYAPGYEPNPDEPGNGWGTIRVDIVRGSMGSPNADWPMGFAFNVPNDAHAFVAMMDRNHSRYTH